MTIPTPSLPSAPPYPYHTSFSDDERLARQLFQQDQDAQMARDLEAQIQREADLARTANHSDAFQHQDAVVAQALEQQLRDEDMARQLALQEEQALQQRQTAAAAANPSRTRRICTTLIPCLIVGMAVAILWFFLNASNGNTAGIPGLPPFLRDMDPFDGLAPGEVEKWRSGGSDGLELTVVNALDQDWHAIFNQVISDWDNGSPDVLSLSVQVINPDAACEAIAGVSKACNGNYGATDWKGINMAVLQRGYIYASTSRVNEYYLSGADTSQKRYTLCHEIGHSFGLPHTDEDFFNKDLGNCMDYTSNPKANQQPDESNFEFLQELYGKQPTEEEEEATEGVDNVDGESDIFNNNGTRKLTSTSTAIPQFVHKAIQQELRVPKKNQNRLLKSGTSATANTASTSTVVELEGGWSLQIQKLL